MIRTLSLVLLAAVPSCAPTTGQSSALEFVPMPGTVMPRWAREMVARATPTTPGRAYGQWWTQLVVLCDCNAHARFEEVTWYVILGDAFPCSEREYCSGVTDQRQHIIILADGYRTSERAVKHEMLHAILGGDAEHRHPLWTWVDGRVSGGH